MTILSDIEITKLSVFTDNPKPLIQPFTENQVRKHEDGTKCISYGVSSYGYDLRAGYEFKIFSNVNSTVVDPKDFDNNSFVEVIAEKPGDYILIPPNSFVLTHSLEKINMPRDVTGVVTGKSTLARCFTGDTKVMLTDGTTPDFNELIERSANGERFWGYSIDDNLNIVISELILPRKIGHEKVIKITLDNGESIKCTPDHKFITRDGLEIEAKDLKPQDSLFHLYMITAPKDNYKVIAIKNIEETQDVFCLTAKEFGNFALASGVFVNNCGVICVCTPLEAGWSGHVTLEFANTTPLPVKLYAGEGCCQVLFYRGTPCKTSYSDRDGKYMNQGCQVVLPKV